jgi:hypothetical protein
MRWIRNLSVQNNAVTKSDENWLHCRVLGCSSVLISPRTVRGAVERIIASAQNKDS